MYYINGTPTHCANCGKKLLRHCWKEKDRFFCNEWCADSFVEPRQPEKELRQ